MVSDFCAPALMDNNIINPKMVLVGEFPIKEFIFCHSSPRSDVYRARVHSQFRGKNKEL